MPTIQQLVRKGREIIKSKSKSRALDIFKHLHAVKILLIGVSPADIQLPMDFPYYQIQRYNNQVYLSAPGLKLIKEDREQKTRLWVSLKQVFSIT